MPCDDRLSQVPSAGQVTSFQDLSNGPRVTCTKISLPALCMLVEPGGFGQCHSLFSTQLWLVSAMPRIAQLQMKHFTTAYNHAGMQLKLAATASVECHCDCIRWTLCCNASTTPLLPAAEDCCIALFNLAICSEHCRKDLVLSCPHLAVLGPASDAPHTGHIAMLHGQALRPFRLQLSNMQQAFREHCCMIKCWGYTGCSCQIHSRPWHSFVASSQDHSHLL